MFHNINDGEHLHLACRYSSNDQLFQLQAESDPANEEIFVQIYAKLIFKHSVWLLKKCQPIRMPKTSVV